MLFWENTQVSGAKKVTQADWFCRKPRTNWVSSNDIKCIFFSSGRFFFPWHNLFLLQQHSSKIQKYVKETVLTQAKKQLFNVNSFVHLSILNEFEVYLPAIWYFSNLGVKMSKTTTMKILLWKMIKTRWYWNFGNNDLKNDL